MEDKIFLVKVNDKKFVSYGDTQFEVECRFNEEVAHNLDFEDYTIEEIELTKEIIDDTSIEYF